MYKTYATANSAFLDLFKHIMQKGVAVKNTKAINNVSFTIRFPENYNSFTSKRKFSIPYAEAEYQWYLTGDRSVEDIGKRAPLWKTMADADGKVWSNYGFHWKQNDQLKRVVSMLVQDKYTRRAVISHYDYNMMHEYSQDTPCNMVLNFQYYDGFLNMTVFARSMDLVFGFCNDQYCFSRLLIDTADKLGFIVGEITFMVSNLHIYEKHFDLI